MSVEVSKLARCSSKTNELRDIDSIECTGPLKKLFHYAIFQKFFHIFIHTNGLCFTIHVIYYNAILFL